MLNKKRLFTMLCSVTIAFSGMCLTVSAQTAGEESGDPAAGEDAVADTVVIYNTAESPDALLDLEVGNTWPVTIDAATGETDCESGEDITLEEALDLTGQQAEELTSGSPEENRDSILDYLEEQDVYEVSEDASENRIQVSFPYAAKELLVFADEGALEDGHGAINSVYCGMTGFYILQYQDEQSAKAACEALQAELGEDRVIVNYPMHASTLYSYKSCNRTSASSRSWGTDLMMMDTMRDKLNAGSISRTVTMAVLDTGINKNHQMFSGRTILSSSTAFITSTGSYSYYDDDGHGSHVAGIIADGTPNQVRFLIIKVFDSNGSGTLQTFLQGLNYAYSKGASLANFSGGITLSSGLTSSNLATLKAFLKYYWDNGTLLICAAGNDGLDLSSSRTYPAYMPYNIAVSGMCDMDPDYEDPDVSGKGYVGWADWSNYGDAIDFIAPGVEVSSASNTSSTGYVSMSGTSMSAPHVAAAAAIEKLYNPKATPAELYQLLRAIAWHTYVPSFNWPDVYQGYGIPTFQNGTPSRLIRTQTIKLARTSCTYSGKSKKPSVTVKHGSSKLSSGSQYKVTYGTNKNVGKGKVKITGKGLYTGSTTKTFKINPKGTKIKKLKKAKKAITVKWAKQAKKMSTSRITGYQIQVATNKAFTKNKKTVKVKGYKKTSRKIKGLKKKKTYYVRIRTYKTVSGTNYYSSWSTAKKVKTR